MKNIRKIILSFIFFSLVSVLSFAEKTPVDGLYSYTLENGLSVFVAENHNAPIAYFEIAFKAGGITTTPENSGLFHLYEHMMFKGNSLYKDSLSFRRKLTELGVKNENGSTGADCVNYYFTIPSDKLEEGMAFWNAAIRTPLMRQDEFEEEKKVVLAEIEGDKANPDNAYYRFLWDKLFPDAPYRLDAGGSFEVVRNATVEQLRDIQNKYYFPANAAIFIGGDVSPEEVYALAEKIFGNWENPAGWTIPKNKQQNVSPFSKTELWVRTDEKMNPSIATFNLFFRGPDAAFDLQDTYPADYLLMLLREPDGKFKTELLKEKSLEIPNADYIYSGFQTTAERGIISFSATVQNPQENLGQRGIKFTDLIKNKLVMEVASDKSVYKKNKVQEIVQLFEDEVLISNETAQSILGNVKFWWLAASLDYYYTYIENIKSVRQKDVISYVKKYITEKEPLLVVTVNPSVYENSKSEFEALGFSTVPKEYSFWWEKEEFKPDSEKIPVNVEVKDESEKIYVPEKKSAEKNKTQRKEVLQYELSNKIPVYIKKSETGSTVAIELCVKGGIENMTEETSGLENVLFQMMALSSEKYSLEKIQVMASRMNFSLNCRSINNGSILELNVLNKYLDETMPVLASGLLSPNLSNEMFCLVQDDLMQSVQYMENDPGSILNYRMMKEIYKSHPFSVNNYVTPDSVKNITLEKVKSYYKNLIGAENIFIVAAGNVEEEKIISLLEKYFGKIPVSDLQAKGSSPEYPSVKIADTSTVVLTHPAMEGTSFVQRVVAAPSVESDDFVGMKIAASVFSSVMYTVVRERYGICYSPSSFSYTSKAPVAVEYLFKVSDLANAQKAMDEARNIMASGKVIETIDENGKYVFENLKDCIEGYKNEYITYTYSSVVDASSSAFNLAYNLFQFDDPYRDEKQMEQLHKLTAEDVVKIFKRYFVDSNSRYFVMTGPENAAFKIKD